MIIEKPSYLEINNIPIQVFDKEEFPFSMDEEKQTYPSIK